MQLNVSLILKGEFLLHGNLREYAGLVKDIVVIGVSTRIEIWSKEKWDAYNDEQDSDDIAEKMSMLGI